MKVSGSLRKGYPKVSGCRLERVNKDLVDRTQELVEKLQVFAEQTTRLEQSNADLIDRTRDLVETRQTLVERTKKLVYSVASCARSSNTTNK